MSSTDTSLYSTLSGVTKINELNMTVEASIDGDKTPPESCRESPTTMI